MVPPRRHSDAFTDDQLSDFVIRKRILPVWQLLVLFALSFTFLYVVATNAQILGGNIGIALAILAVIGPLTWFTVYFSQQNRDMLLAAEFQNALFSAAARIKSKFVMIVKDDGTVFYYDRGFQQSFPEAMNRGTLMADKIFSSQQITPVEAAKFQAALAEKRSETVFITLRNPDGSEQKVIINIDPLSRPEGFCSVRGRDYVTKRKDRDSGSNVATTTDLSAPLGKLLDAVPYGLYATDAKGTLLAANAQLEAWLGYETGEILSRKLGLMELLAEENTPLINDILLHDCDGALLFLHKNGHPVQLYVMQQIVRGAKGAIEGSCALLRAEADTSHHGIASTSALEAARQPEKGDDLSAPTRLSGNSEQ